MTLRDARGRFLPGHPWASEGGRARARKLTPEKRRAIARRGFQGLVEKRFDGDKQAAVDWLTAKGQWATDKHYPPAFRVFSDPGPMPGGSEI